MTPLERLTSAVTATAFSIERIEACFAQFNEPKWPELLAQPLGLAKEYLAINRSLPTPSVAEDYVDLAGILGEIEWPPTGADPVNDTRVFDLQDRVNRLVLNCLTIVSAAKEMGIGYAQPTSIHPDGLQVPRTGQAATLAAIAGHVDDLEFQLNQLVDSRNDSAASQRQQAIVASYRQVVTSNIHKIRAAIQTGSTLALEVLDRSGGALVTATRQFIATVRAGASRATPALRTAAKAVSKPVQGMVRSVGAIVKRILGEAEKPTPPLPDDFVEQAKTMILAGTAPPAHWVPHLTDLNFRDGALSDLGPLSNLNALKFLELSNNPISDLNPLAKLTALRDLYMSRTQVSDLAPLAKLTELQCLSLSTTKVRDLTPLAGLTTLKRLDLMGTQVSEIAPLAKLTKLQRLGLMSTNVSDLTPLAKLTALRDLDLWGTPIDDLGPLAKLSSLERLDLWNTRVSDLAPLAKLTSLERLDLINTPISVLDPLAELIALQAITLDGTQVSDLAPLAELTALRRLDLARTPINELAPLAKLAALERLVLRSVQISDLAPLSELTALKRLDLVDTAVSDLGAVSHHPALEVETETEERAKALRKTLHKGSAVKVVVPEYLKVNKPKADDPAS